MLVVHEDLKETLSVLPAGVVARLRSYPLRIWINLDDGTGKKGCCCHCIDHPREFMSCKSHSVKIFDIQDALLAVMLQRHSL